MAAQPSIPDLVAAGAARVPAGTVVRGGRLVNVVSAEVYPADVAVYGNTVVAIGDVSAHIGDDTRIVEAEGRHLVPGLFDGHQHLECSKLSITSAAKMLVPLGTLNVVSGLDQILVVAGLDGAEAFLRESQRTPLRVLWGAPCKTPYTLPTSTVGHYFGPDDHREAQRWPECVGVWETVREFVATGDPDVLEAMEIARENRPGRNAGRGGEARPGGQDPGVPRGLAVHVPVLPAHHLNPRLRHHRRRNSGRARHGHLRPRARTGCGVSGAVIDQAELGAGRTMTGAVIDQAELDVLRRHWHPVARSDAIDSGPVGVVLLGEPLVVFRLSGRACAASDRCPHRGSPLSLGSYDDDCLVCPYHGLRYSADGQCVGFPARPDARLPQRLSLHTLPTRECHGLVWACPDEPAADDLPDWGFYDRPDVQTFQIGPVRWQASASRVAENFNDIAHFSTIHRVTFGPSDRPVAPQKVTATDTGFTSTVGVFQQYRNTLDGSVTEVEAAYRYDFTFPFSSMLTITYPDGEIECIQLAATPESATSCLVFQRSARTNLGGDSVEPWRDFQAAVNEEDRVICQAMRPREVSFRLDGTGEVALPTDAFSIAYRRLWKSLCSTQS